MLRKKLRYGFALVLTLATSAVVWRVWAQEKTLSRADWAPDKGMVTFFDRGRAEIELTWDRKVPSAKDNSLEVEIVVPGWKRGLVDRTRVFNHLDKTVASRLPSSCQYKDIAFWDPCENWAQGLLLTPNCLESVTPGTLKILMETDEVPPSVTSARLLVSRSEKGGLTDRMRVAGGASGCTAICAACQGGPVPVNWVCPPIFGQWLKDLCGQCDRAWEETTPEWNYFSASSTWCAEPVSIPGSSEFIGCGAPPFGVTCDDPIRNDAPKKICVPQEKTCGSGSTVTRCSNDGLHKETVQQCLCTCTDGACQPAVCEPGPPVCKDQNAKRICSANGCGFVDSTCACGCSNGVCQPVVCTSSYCRDATSLIQCVNGGCGTQVVSCGYGCSNNRCNDAPSPPDLSSGGTPPPDMSTSPPPPDLTYIPPGTEVCDGKDNNGNGQVDELPSCWLTIYRFRDPATNARCYGPTNIAPPICTGYVFEKELFTVPSTPWLDGSTNERVQCSSGTNHIITIKNGGEHTTLQASGWSCNVSLGYWFQTGTGKTAGTPYSFTCPVYRSWYTTSGGTAHVFSSQTESFFGTFTCEAPTRGNVLQNVLCGRPSGC